jgi:hypothetical protein
MSWLDRCQSSSLQQSSRCSQRHLRLSARAKLEVSDGGELQMKRLSVPTQRLTEFASAVLRREALRTVGAEGGGHSHHHLGRSEDAFTIQYEL